MARRILAALVVIGAALATIPARLSGEPTTSRPRAGPSATTSTTVTPPNPHIVYPRRPGARYSDIEVPPGASVTLNAPLSTALSIASSTVTPRRALPRRLRPAKVSDARERDLVDGYTPVSTDTPGDVLHVVVRAKDGTGPIPLLCSATATSDGTVLIPYYDAGGTPPLPVPGPTAAGATRPAFYDLNLYLPLGTRRGRIYLACQLALFLGMTKGDLARFVWAIDV
jgi:hypothetical protein